MADMIPHIGDNGRKGEIEVSLASLKHKLAQKNTPDPNLPLSEIMAIGQAAKEAAAIAIQVDAEQKAETFPHKNAIAQIKAAWTPLAAEAGNLKEAFLTVAVPFALRLNKKGSEMPAGSQMRIVKRAKAKVTNYEAAINHFSGEKKLRDLIDKLADEEARRGLPTPGCEITEKVSLQIC